MGLDFNATYREICRGGKKTKSIQRITGKILMSFDINEIKAQAIGKDSPIGGYVRPNLCLVTISPPAGATDQLRKAIPTLSISCV